MCTEMCSNIFLWLIDLPGSSILVSDQPSSAADNLVTDQPEPLLQLSLVQQEIVTLCDIPRSVAMIMEHLGLKHRAFFRRIYLEPLLRGGGLPMTYPPWPNHPQQAYVPTEIGMKLKACYLAQGTTSERLDGHVQRRVTVPLSASEFYAGLAQRFPYDGRGPIPEQIWSWRQKSATLGERMKGQDREASDASLRAKAKDRRYVPEPSKAQDLGKLHERNVLREFEEYKAFKGRRLKVFRLEAVRAWFKKVWAERNYQTILDVARTIPEQVLQEDQKLVMWYDQALTRTGGEA